MRKSKLVQLISPTRLEVLYGKGCKTFLSCKVNFCRFL